MTTLFQYLPILRRSVFYPVLCVAIVSLLIEACGGGGGNSNTPADANNPQPDHALPDSGQPTGYLYYIAVSNLVRHDLSTGLRTIIDLDSAWSGLITSVSVSEDSSYYIVLDNIYDKYAVLDSELNIKYENSTNGIYTKVPLISNDKTKVVYGWELNWHDDEGDKVRFDSLDGAFETKRFDLFGMLYPQWIDNQSIMILYSNALYSVSTASDVNNEFVQHLSFSGTVTDFALSPDRKKVAFPLALIFTWSPSIVNILRT